MVGQVVWSMQLVKTLFNMAVPMWSWVVARFAGLVGDVQSFPESPVGFWIQAVLSLLHPFFLAGIVPWAVARLVSRTELAENSDSSRDEPGSAIKCTSLEVEE